MCDTRGTTFGGTYICSFDITLGEGNLLIPLTLQQI